ncbi:MAG TPA: NAD(P)-dependent oxidoreductase, partial [Burkholderiales bacterium]|nr:NAD(P)-dependent oxidoreductase [Burkholderiales bacterium]
VDPIAAAGEEFLGRHAEVVRAPDSDPATIRQLAAGVDGIITRSKLPDDVFDAAPRVRGVAIHGTGIDLVPLDSATARGVMVSNIPGGNAQSVAEYCVMAMLMLARNVPAILSTLKKQTWDGARALGAHAHEIADMTVGLVGVGAIGTRVARIARNGLGMRVLGTQRRLDRLPAEAEPSSLDELLPASDFVVVTCPLTPQTRHLLNEKTVSLMKRAAWLINVGRGPVVHEAALIAALAERRIAGAMLDVYENYRLEPGNPLFDLDNVILTPHLAGMTRESRARMSVAAAEEVVRMLAGEAPRNFVNPQAVGIAHH